MLGFVEPVNGLIFIFCNYFSILQHCAFYCQVSSKNLDGPNAMCTIYVFHFRTVPEMEDQSVMSPPTFINLPPPYSEQPSPMYNLCNTAAAATLSTSSYTSSITTGNGGQQHQYCELHLSRLNLGQVGGGCCYHHHICTNNQNHQKPEESIATEDEDGDKSILTDETST